MGGRCTLPILKGEETAMIYRNGKGDVVGNPSQFKIACESTTAVLKWVAFVVMIVTYPAWGRVLPMKSA